MIGTTARWIVPLLLDEMSRLYPRLESGFAPALLPASAAHGTSSDGWRSVEVDRLSTRIVGLARNRRTVPAAPPRAVGETIRRIVQQEAGALPHIHAVNAQSPQGHGPGAAAPRSASL